LKKCSPELIESGGLASQIDQSPQRSDLINQPTNVNLSKY